MAESYEPLYTAAEMRAAEERYPGYPDTIPELMERAGAAVAREAMLAYPAATQLRVRVRRRLERRRRARRRARAARGGARRGRDRRGLDGLRRRRRRALRNGVPAARRARRPPRSSSGSTRPARRSSRSTSPPASTPPRARSQARSSTPTSRSRSTPRRSGSPSRPGRFHAGRVVVADIGLGARRRRPRASSAPALLEPCRARGAATRSTRPAPCSSSAGSRG